MTFVASSRTKHLFVAGAWLTGLTVGLASSISFFSAWTDGSQIPGLVLDISLLLGCIVGLFTSLLASSPFEKPQNARELALLGALLGGVTDFLLFHPHINEIKPALISAAIIFTRTFGVFSVAGYTGGCLLAGASFFREKRAHDQLLEREKQHARELEIHMLKARREHERRQLATRLIDDAQTQAQLPLDTAKGTLHFSSTVQKRLQTPLGTSNLLLADVSQFNLPIDGSVLARAIASDQAGNFGAFIVRVGTGLDLNNPSNMTDDGYAKTSATLRENGISFGRYWQIDLNQDPEKQANAALSIAGPLQTGDWPYIWFDAETLGGQSGHAAAAALLVAVKRVQRVSGWKAGIYANLNTFSQMDLSVLTGIPKWVANWGTQPPQLAGLDNIILWQFAGGDGAQAGSFYGVGSPDNPHCDLSVYILDSSVFFSEIIA